MNKFPDIPQEIILNNIQLQPFERAMCFKDFRYFLFRWVKTLDEHDSDRIKLFPRLEYIEKILDIVDRSTVILIAKSRQMMMTWLILAYCLWYAISREKSKIIVQSQKIEYAYQLLERISEIYENLPDFLKVCKYKKSGGGSSTLCKILFSNGSVIFGVPQGSKQFRMFTSNIVFIDEAAFIDDLLDSVASARPGLVGGKDSKLFIVSSADYGDFATLYFDEKEVEAS